MSSFGIFNIQTPDYTFCYLSLNCQGISTDGLFLKNFSFHRFYFILQKINKAVRKSRRFIGSGTCFQSYGLEDFVRTHLVSIQDVSENKYNFPLKKY